MKLQSFIHSCKRNALNVLIASFLLHCIVVTFHNYCSLSEAGADLGFSRVGEGGF